MAEMIGPIREELSTIDSEILKLLEKRFELVEKMWKIKKKNSIPYRDEKKELEVIQKLWDESKLNKEFISVIYKHIFNENERLFG